METPKRRSVDPIYSMCVQPSFIIGTNNEDGTAMSDEQKTKIKKQYEKMKKQAESGLSKVRA